MRRRLRPTILLQALNALLLLAILLVQIDIRLHMAPTAGEFRAAKGARLRALAARIPRVVTDIDGVVSVNNVGTVRLEPDDLLPLPVVVKRGEVEITGGEVNVSARQALPVVVER